MKKPFSKNKIYMDYAATTPVDPRVVEMVLPYLSKKFGNASSIHSFGQEARKKLEESRETIAEQLNAETEEIIFTGSATESNNLALKGTAWANRKKGRHILISSIEHDCVMKSGEWLRRQGYEMEKIPVDEQGLVDPEQIKGMIREDTILVSVIHASNEIGTVQPIREIGEICSKHDLYFHTDAAQSFGKRKIDVRENKIDLLTASSHKIYGPKGAACLFVKKGVEMEPLLHGGGQERGLRSSTSNVGAIAGFARAVEICEEEREKETKRLTELRNNLIRGVLKRIPDSHLNGHPEKRLSNNVNLRFDFVEGESMVMMLNEKGVAASTGSACSSKALEPSHVLTAIGLRPEQAHGSLRLTLGRWSTEKEVEYVLEILPGIIKDLRKISPYGK